MWCVWVATKIRVPLRKDVIRLMLKSASRGRTLTYGEIMRKCRIPRGQPVRNGKAIGDVVGLISEWTRKEWGIYLSAIEVHKNTSYPGGGFFGLPGIPARFARDEAAWADQGLTLDEKAFLKRRREDVFAWAKRWKTIG
jgi:hypothetical protein